MIRRVDHLSVLTDWPGERLAVRLTGIQWNACPDLAANNDLSVGNAFRAAIKLEHQPNKKRPHGDCLCLGELHMRALR